MAEAVVGQGLRLEGQAERAGQRVELVHIAAARPEQQPDLRVFHAL
jgi:hypothetical protein